MPRKILYVILDGLGDDPVPSLDGRTPLAAARTPNLDAIAAKGRSGLVTTVAPDIAPESDIAVFSILGYDPEKQHAGRGPLEALGSGIEMRDGDVAWRANYATVDERGTIVDRRAGRDLSDDEARALAEALNEAVSLEGGSATFKATSEHRGVLHLRAARPMSGEISNTDPAYERRGALGVALETFDPYPLEARALDPTDGGAVLAAELTNLWSKASRDVLGSHPVNSARSARNRPPANIVLVRDAGDHIPVVQSLKERFGMDWACFAEMPVEIGISRVTGMTPVLVSASGTDPDAYARLATQTLETLGGYDGLYVHIKGPDVPAHDGRAEDKRDSIAAIDEGYFGTVLPELDPDTVLAVTADHSTSCVRKAHTADPVPLVVAGPGISADGVTLYSEAAAADGSLGHLRGVQVLPLLVEMARG
ncbi:MAG TPA: alkaline phosphatase family protein [Actinomycetota bacterium]|nr:alkaline phosphatase family protein [Actinomycetota bacterium]